VPVNALEREDGGRRSQRVLPRPGRARAWIELIASLRQDVVAANMIGVGPGVDHIANWLGRDPLDRRNHGRRADGRPRVYDDDAVVAHLHADIPARASDHEEVGPDFQHLEVGRRGRARGLRACRNRRLDCPSVLNEAECHAAGHGSSQRQTARVRAGSISWQERHSSLDREA
jgi:hypothetical protein